MSAPHRCRSLPGRRAVARARRARSRSGRRVAEALRGAGVEVRVLDVDAGLLASLRGRGPPSWCPLLHGAPVRTARCATCSSCSRCPTWASRPAASRIASTSRRPRRVLADRRLATPRVGDALPQHLPRAGRARR